MVLDETLAVTSAGPSVKPVLQLKGVGKTYRRGDEQVNVLVDFDFTLDAGEFVVVTGRATELKQSDPSGEYTFTRK